MKPLIQKLPLNENSSFVSRTYSTPDFEVPWHNHLECELILFTQGNGMSFIGNYIGNFEEGDIFFLAKNLPHTFQKRQPDMVASAIVIQFREDFLGSNFFSMPESRLIIKMLDDAVRGLKINGKNKGPLTLLIKEIEKATGFQRIIDLCNCLHIISTNKNNSYLSDFQVKKSGQKGNEKIDKIFEFTINGFKTPLKVADVAKIAHMSVPAFCNYFKKCTKKTYINFLNEIRVGYACRLLSDSMLNINEICYESGYNSLAHFNKQFHKIKKITPSGYRKLSL